MIKHKLLLFIALVVVFAIGRSQSSEQNKEVYKNRVLESTEIDILTSYYSQDGQNAAVTGGRGTEELTDITGTLVVSIPLSDDDVLTLDAGISAYTSASSSNINPFDKGFADPFIAASGASRDDTWYNITGNYSHSSDDRNSIWTANLSYSTEYDYNSLGFGGSYTRLFNEKNTELGFRGNVFLDKWTLIYPYELRPFAPGGRGLEDFLFIENTITGNPNYSPDFSVLTDQKRNSYSFGVGLSQILTKNIQGTFLTDLVLQQGLLSTPFQRVYFSDVADSFIDNFHLADDIERLPDSRFKVALGGRLNFFINEYLVVRSYYRYYFDDWGINSNTLSIEVPVKIARKFTLYPSYRFYNQQAADYFAPYNQHLSTSPFYTSDYDLSKYNANQFGFGINYTNIIMKQHKLKFGLKSIDVKYNYYKRNTGLSAGIITAGFKFVVD
ncbi:DUF3570 domain-containing protein [uncultured Eudoraea sp.]|uniref:DUF3570 domain-containing protein n=1 Tax=uncultured Eudoraea sp. TaxID=1035614 RepID=UPI00263502D7|nr:DUF3570 domain-containing protein [uncultured Eudoraea sp.]